MFRRPAMLLLLAIAAVYWPALSGSYVYDDEALIVQNPAVQNGDLWALLTKPLWGSESGYWRPLLSVLFWFGHSLGGATGIHAFALLLHATAVLLAWQLARRLLNAPRAAFWIALLFAVHPVQVESVAWCAALNDPLWVTAALAAMHSAVRWRDAGGHGLPWGAASWCLAAMLSKEPGVLAVALVLATLRWVPPTAPAGQLRPALLALGGAVGIWWLLRALVFGAPTAGFLAAPALPPGSSLLLAAAPVELLAEHLLLLVKPFPLTPFRPWQRPDLLLQFPVASLVGAGALLLACARLRPSPAVCFWLTVLLLPLLPSVLGWRSLGSYPIADRYLYLPVLGAAALLVPRLLASRAWVLVPCLCITLAATAFTQTWVWHDQQRLVTHGLRSNPNDATLHAMAGDLALGEAQRGVPLALDAARAAYARALQHAAQQGQHHGHRATAAAHLGLAWCLLLEQGGRRGPGTPQLVALFQRAVDSDPTKPAAWVGLGVGNAIAERFAEAERAFQQAIALDHDRADAWFNLGRLQAQTNHVAKARNSLQQALRCNPHHATARQLLDQLR